MKNIYLCGHTGSQNRGCEAIVRSISYILNELKLPKENRYLFSYDKEYDEFLNINNIINIIPYHKRGLINRGVIYIKRKILNNKLKSYKSICQKDYTMSANDSILFAIGGDTYCYSTPYLTFAYNDLAKKKNITNIFYGCSIDSSALDNEEMCEDINNYSYIITRESYSRDIFKKILKDKNRLFYACDPAFQLPIKETKLPQGFKRKNTLGLNISPLVFKDYKDEKDIMYKNIFNLIDYTLNETDMSVCLIPHVYNIENNTQDIFVLNNIYKKYIGNDRVSIINNELSCTELKYIISNCRFFIGARTHATIAAYSTEVPTIVISYSIKSRGIANDLFGTEEGFLIKWQDVKKENDIKNIFISSLVKNEEIIKKKYQKVLPEYKKTIIEVTKTILESCDYNNEK